MHLQILTGALAQRLARAAFALCHASFLAWLCPLRAEVVPAEGRGSK